MNGALCRCMTYYRIQSAVRRASDAMADGTNGADGVGGQVER